MEENNTNTASPGVNDAVLARKQTLFERALQLPLSPGIYIMKGRSGSIIYVGKSKVLKNRVSQYFSPYARHNLKTAKMTESVYDFEYVLTSNEMEALTLENQLIKLHKPKFNIKLKDGKTYPFIKVNLGRNGEYPSISVVRSRTPGDINGEQKNEKAKYFGPYSGSAFQIVRTVQKTFGVASCAKQFPQDIGKSRPCLYGQLGQCLAPCAGKITETEYREVFADVLSFLRGDIKAVKQSLEEKMEYAAENLLFETAAKYRDRVKAVTSLWEKQKVVILSSPETDCDVFALYTEERCSCLAVFYVRGGSVVDSESFLFGAEQIADNETVVSFLCSLYTNRGNVPREILTEFELNEEDTETLVGFAASMGCKTRVRRPERGELRGLCTLVYENAKEKAMQYLAESERDNKMLIKLAQMLSLEVVPERIEAFDVSNFGNENIICGMICAENGKLRKSEYRTYNIKGQLTQNDYSAMREAVQRRLSHGDHPDLILLDGGKGHVSTIRKLLAEMEIDIPVFGMVKDEYHKTRALTSDTEDISIAREQTVFTFIYKLQEELHRFTVTKMSKAKGSTLKKSSLEKIDGIGSAKALLLMKHFKTIANIKNATQEQLCEVKGISQKNAGAILEYFSKE